MTNPTVQLPDLPSATLMVYRVFSNVGATRWSYARRPISVGIASARRRPETPLAPAVIVPDLFSAPDEPEQADHAELAAALALALAPGIRPARWRALVGRHGSARARSCQAQRLAQAGLPGPHQAALASPDAAAIRRELTWAGRPGTNRLLLPARRSSAAAPPRAAPAGAAVGDR